MSKGILLKIIRWGIYLCLLLPLFVSRQFYFPFVFPRTVIFRMLIEIIFIFWLILVLKDRTYLPKRTALFWSLSVLAGVFLLTSLTSVDPAKSFLGTMERGSGVFTWFHYYAFFIILTGIFQKKEDWLSFLKISISVSLMVSLYALGQRLGLQSVYESGVDRATGTIGNAAFLASYLILAIGLLLAFFFYQEKKDFHSEQSRLFWKIFGGIALSFNLLALYLTGTRGAVLGILAGFFFFSLAYLFLFPSRAVNPSGAKPWTKEVRGLTSDGSGGKTKKYLAILLIAVIIASFVIWSLRDNPVLEKIPGLARLAKISLKEGTAQTRLLAWQTAWSGWKEKFLLGWGPENFNVLFNKHSQSQFYQYGGGETWFDKAHNIILDIGSTSGAIGLAAYLSVFGSAFWLIWRQRKTNYLLSLILFAVLVAYFAQDLFVFDIFNSFLLLFLIFGFVSFLAIEGALNSKDSNNIRLSQKPGREMPGQAITAVSLIALILFLFFWQVNFKPLLASYWSAKSFRQTQMAKIKGVFDNSKKATDTYSAIIADYKKTMSYQTYGDPEIRADFIGFIFDSVEKKSIGQKEREEALDFAISQASQSIEANPLNARWYLLAAKLWQANSEVRGSQDKPDQESLRQAENLIRKGIELSPQKIALRYILVQTLLMQERPQESLAAINSAIELYQKMPDSYWYLSLTCISLKDETSAMQALDQAMNYGYTFQNINDLNLAASLYSQRNDLPRLEKIYPQAIRLEPKNLQWYASLATVYSKLGQKDKAIETANRIIEIDPDSRPEVEQFIKGL